MSTHSTLPAALGQLIRQKRVILGVTREELSSRCQLSPTTVGRLEQGDDKVGLSAWLVCLEKLDMQDLLLSAVQAKLAALALESGASSSARPRARRMTGRPCGAGQG